MLAQVWEYNHWNEISGRYIFDELELDDVPDEMKEIGEDQFVQRMTPSGLHKVERANRDSQKNRWGTPEPEILYSDAAIKLINNDFRRYEETLNLECAFILVDCLRFGRASNWMHEGMVSTISAVARVKGRSNQMRFLGLTDDGKRAIVQTQEHLLPKGLRKNRAAVEVPLSKVVRIEGCRTDWRPFIIHNDGRYWIGDPGYV